MIGGFDVALMSIGFPSTVKSGEDVKMDIIINIFVSGIASGAPSPSASAVYNGTLKLKTDDPFTTGKDIHKTSV